tara:strand:- start:169 stop:753 length:585 start_codon:yes stop_codon:yes gene_type:complete
MSHILKTAPCDDLLWMIGQQVDVERERLAEVARLAAEVVRLANLDFHIKDFSQMELPIPEGQTDNSPATPIPEGWAAEGYSWCCLLVDTNSDLVNYGLRDDDARNETALAEIHAFGYTVCVRDDALMDLEEEGTSRMPPFVGRICIQENNNLCEDFSSACGELVLELRADGVSVDEAVAAFKKWGLDVVDLREE